MASCAILELRPRMLYCVSSEAVDKSVAMLEFAEENSMFSYTSDYGRYAFTDKEYRKEL